jgi:hypothetical protein
MYQRWKRVQKKQGRNIEHHRQEKQNMPKKQDIRVYRRHAQQVQQKPKLAFFFFKFFSGRACDLRHARQSNVNPKKKE